jgi:hypothetical protein
LLLLFLKILRSASSPKPNLSVTQLKIANKQKFHTHMSIILFQNYLLGKMFLGYFRSAVIICNGFASKSTLTAWHIWLACELRSEELSVKLKALFDENFIDEIPVIFCWTRTDRSNLLTIVRKTEEFLNYQSILASRILTWMQSSC